MFLFEVFVDDDDDEVKEEFKLEFVFFESNIFLMFGLIILVESLKVAFKRKRTISRGGVCCLKYVFDKIEDKKLVIKFFKVMEELNLFFGFLEDKDLGW